MSITVLIGPMFSGKSEELIRLISRANHADRKTVIIKHTRDTRYDHESKTSNHITSHNDIVYDKSDFIISSELTNSMLEQIINKYDVVGIDEGFFFKSTDKNTVTLTYFCNTLANNNISVIVSTLDGSYKQEIFPEIATLIANSEKVIKFTAICMQCKIKDASFTVRLNTDDNEIVVGGKDIYKSVCRKCLLLLKK
jgi:thymidine kinase